MKLNRLEFLAMNNPMRALIQEKYELKILRNMTSLSKPGRVLEIGCGNGTGSRLIKKYFSPDYITSIDLDERMVRRAKKRNNDTTISYHVMDASKLGFPDRQFDAVFDFGIIHHIPDWKDCLLEIQRVLKPGGELILEDLSILSFTMGIGKLWRILSRHPYESMYTPREFTGFMKERGFTIHNYREFNPLHCVRFFSLNATVS